MRSVYLQTTPRLYSQVVESLIKQRASGYPAHNHLYPIPAPPHSCFSGQHCRHIIPHQPPHLSPSHQHLSSHTESTHKPCFLFSPITTHHSHHRQPLLRAQVPSHGLSFHSLTLLLSYLGKRVPHFTTSAHGKARQVPMRLYHKKRNEMRQHRFSSLNLQCYWKTLSFL